MTTKRKNPQLSPPRTWYELQRWRRLWRHRLRVRAIMGKPPRPIIGEDCWPIDADGLSRSFGSKTKEPS